LFIVHPSLFIVHCSSFANTAFYSQLRKKVWVDAKCDFRKLIFSEAWWWKSTNSTNNVQHNTTMSITASISKAISTALLGNLPKAFADEFSLDEEAVKTWLAGYLKEQLGSSATARKPAEKGADGKSKRTGYILFCAYVREGVKAEAEGEMFEVKRKNKETGEMETVEVSSIPPTEVTKRAAALWKALSDAERQEWVAKATEMNEANGFTTPEKSPAKTPVKAPVKPAAKAVPAKPKAPAKAPAKPAAKKAPAKKTPVSSEEDEE